MAEIRVTLLDDFGVEQRIAIVELGSEVDVAVWEDEWLGKFLGEKARYCLMVKLFEMFGVLDREFELGEFDGAIEVDLGC